MNDHDAMTAINAALEDYYRGRITDHEAVTRIAQIAGENHIDHQESK